MEKGVRSSTTLASHRGDLEIEGTSEHLTLQERLRRLIEQYGPILPNSIQQQFSTEVMKIRSEVAIKDIDPITGLKNRAVTWSYLLWAVGKSRGPGLGLLYTDVDDFTQFNDDYGHAGGDKALAALGAILGQEGREADLIGRFGEGSDEFMVILSSVISGNKFESAALRICKALNDPEKQRVAGYDFDLPLKVSVGCVWVKWPANTDRRKYVQRIANKLYQSVDALMSEHKASRTQQKTNGGSEPGVPFTYFRLYKGRLVPYRSGHWV